MNYLSNSVPTISPSTSTVNFSSASTQTIPAFIYNSITNTGNGTRTLANGTILIAGTFTPGSGNYTIGTSTVEFNGSSAQTIPVIPTASGGNYYNLTYSGSSIGTIGGSMTVVRDLSVTGGTLLINNATSYTLTIQRNLLMSGANSAKIDFNSGGSGTSIINLAGNLDISGTGNALVTSGNVLNGTIIFNGSNQSYSNTTSVYNGGVNFTISNGSTLSLLNSLNLYKSTNALFQGTVTISSGGTLIASTFNIITGNGSAGTAIVTVAAGGTFSTSNTGGIEGTGNSGTNGTITTTAITRNYNAGAHYVLNAATATPFPTSGFGNPGNLIINAAVTNNTPISMSGVLTLTNGILTTTATNTLTLTNTANNAINGGSTTGFINGPVTWTLGTTSTGTYTVPVGVNAAYYPMSFVAGTIASGSPTINVQAFATGVSTADGTTLSTTSGNEYWKIVTVGSSFAANSFSLGRSTPALGTLDAMGKSTTNTTLSYNYIGGTACTSSCTLGVPSINTSVSGLSGASTLYLSLAKIASPTITTTVAANTITDVAASSGGQTISTGASLTAKGVVWNTSTTPTIALTTKTNDGTTSADFTSSLTSLSPQTQYYVRAYATSAYGTGYSNEINFRTLSSPATIQASGFSATATSISNIDLSWTGATFPSSGATTKGYLLYRASGVNTPIFAGSNGGAPSAGANTTLVTTLAYTDISFSNASLNFSTTYNYLLIPFTWDGTNAATYNYLTASAVTANATTQAPTTPVITTSGTLSALSTTYGTASSSNTTFTVSGTSLTNDIIITPPSGFEVSQTVGGASGYAATQTLTQSGGSVATTTIYVRLAATAFAGTYSGDVVVSSIGASPANVATASSTVSPYTLTLGLTGVNKIYDGTTAATVSGIATLSATVNGDVITLNTSSPTATFTSKNVANGITINITGYSLSGTNSTSYTLSTTTTANITAKALTAVGSLVFPASKVYNGNTTATPTSGAAALQSAQAAGAGTTSDGIPYTGDVVSLTGTAVYAFNSKDVANATTITASNLSLTS
jgi:hypothetical protein